MLRLRRRRSFGSSILLRQSQPRMARREKVETHWLFRTIDSVYIHMYIYCFLFYHSVPKVSGHGIKILQVSTYNNQCGGPPPMPSNLSASTRALIIALCWVMSIPWGGRGGKAPAESTGEAPLADAPSSHDDAARHTDAVLGRADRDTWGGGMNALGTGSP